MDVQSWSRHLPADHKARVLARISRSPLHVQSEAASHNLALSRVLPPGRLRPQAVWWAPLARRPSGGARSRHSLPAPLTRRYSSEKVQERQLDRPGAGHVSCVPTESQLGAGFQELPRRTGLNGYSASYFANWSLGQHFLALISRRLSLCSRHLL